MKLQPLHLVIPMSGQGSRYQSAGYSMPKPMIPVSGVPMIEKLLQKFPESWPCTFILAENHRDSGLEALLKKLRPTCHVEYIPPHNLGPARPLEVAVKKIPADHGVLVSYCDFGMVWDPWQFQEFVSATQCDSCLVSYRGFHAHYLSKVSYAYSRLEGPLVKEIREKGSFTDQRENEFASCGIYYFRDAKTLSRALSFQFENSLKINGEYYTSLTVQALLQMEPQAQVRVFEIPYFFQWGTPNDLLDFEYWEQTFRNLSANRTRHQIPAPQTDQILLPMAGLGSRFSPLTKLKKPFIKVANEALYEKALNCLPKSPSINIISLNTLAPQVDRKYHFLGLPETPAGQALTVKAGLSLLALDKSVIVSACDHGLVINSELWQKFVSETMANCDAAVFCIKNFPGSRRSPNSYSYVETESTELFPRVKKIHLKRPVSANPSQDHLLVGTFWFKNAKILQMGIEKLQQVKNEGLSELYLDGIFDQLSLLGMKCVVFPLDGYMNWGDPESLKEALYWEEVYSGQYPNQREAFPNVDFGGE